MLQTGDLLKDRYRIERILGRGGMGTVYLALEEGRSRQVAVKELQVDMLDPKIVDKAVAQFQHEGELLSGLAHPNLVDVHETFAHGGNHYLVMEFVDGTDLGRHAESMGGRLPFPEVLELARALAAVLHYLHTQSPPIIFRDLKPSNIMLDAKGHPHLIDFGISRLLEDDTQTRTYVRGVGSAGFAPLEQYTNAGTDARSDLYSLGATLYDLLSGSPPPSPLSLLSGEEVLRPLRLQNAEVPAWFATLVMRMLALRKDDRISSAADVQRALETQSVDERADDSTAALIKTVRDAVTERVAPPTEPPPQRRSGWSRILLAGVALAGLAAGGLAWSSNRAPTLAHPEQLESMLRAGQPVRLPAGTFTLPHHLEVDGRLQLEGQGPDKTHLVALDGQAALIFRNGPCRLRGIDFETRSRDFCYAVMLINSDADVSNCSFHGARRLQGRGGSGLRISGPSHGSVRECEAWGNQKNGIQATEQADLDIVSNRCHDNGFGGIGLIDNSVGRVTSNICNQNGYGIMALQRARGELSGNTCKGNRHLGVAAFEESTLSLTDNKLEDNEEYGSGCVSRAALQEKGTRYSGNRLGERTDALPAHQAPR